MAAEEAGALPAVHDTGGGDAVVFLHAYPLDASQWDHQVAALSGDHRCLRPDAWGCGDSPPPVGAPSLDALASDVLRALDTMGVGDFALVGLSMGGYLAMAVLRAAPSRVRAVALCNTRASADMDAVQADRLATAERVLRDGSVEALVEPSVERLLGPRARSEPHISDPLRGRIRRWTPDGIAWALRAMAARPDSAAQLASLRVPALCVGSAEDAVVPPAEVRAMADAIPGSTHVELDCGHLSNLELPGRFSGVLGEFLATGYPGAAPR